MLLGRILLAGVLLSVAASAVPITYTFVVSASGFIGSTPFTNQTLTFTVTTDTSLITPFLGGQITPVLPVSSVSVSTPAGTATFVNVAVVRADPSSGLVALSSGGNLNVFSPLLNGYDLRTAIGSVTSSGGTIFQTSLGTLTFSGGVTFTASLALQATPLPPSIVLTLVGLACMGLYMARRKLTRFLAVE
jgi:hypothetical protein